MGDGGEGYGPLVSRMSEGELRERGKGRMVMVMVMEAYLTWGGL